ncbi:MAG: alpha/beta hydrolase [Crocinitomicaceae bacterium]
MIRFKNSKLVIYKLLIGVTLVNLVYSCSMSWTFHRPNKMPNLEVLENYSFEINNDIVRLKYDKINDEIIFIDSNRNKLPRDYTIKSEFFKSASGNELNGWLLTPKNVKPKTTILQFHGSGGNLIFHQNLIEPLVEQGFQVFCFDYSGYGLSNGKATRKNVELDAYSAFEHVLKKTEVKGTNLVLYGQSYGGYLAAVVGTENQQKIKAMVLEAAFTSHKAEAAYTVPVIGYIVKNGKTTTTKKIKEYRKPLLIIHSIDDKRTPFKMGEKIYDNANDVKELFKIDKGHCQGLTYYSKEITVKIENMLAN